MNQGAVGYGMHSDLNEAQANCLRAKIGLYQLIFPAVARWQERIFGPFNVQVQIEDTEYRSANPRVFVRWRTKNDAYITYDRVDRRTAVAWMPDDPYWHNRLYLMDSPALLNQVALKRTHEGIMQPPEVALEIRCLEEALHEDVPVWTAIENRRMLGDFEGKKEAENWISDLTAPSMKMIDGVMTATKVKKRKIEIVERKKRVYKPKIAELIEKEKYKHDYGWTQCTYFMEEIRPAVLQEVENRRGSIDAAEAGETPKIFDLLRSVANMSDDEKVALRTALFDSKKTNVKEPQSGVSEVTLRGESAI